MFRIRTYFSFLLKVVSVEKSVCVREEEVLLVNGTPITLEGEEGKAIKDCLLRGAIPNQVTGKAAQKATSIVIFQDLINHLLIKAGLLLKPMKVSTELNVKSSTTRSENVFLHKNGEILDEQCRQRSEVQEYRSEVEEDWQPIEFGQGVEQDDGNISTLSEAGKSLRDRLKSTDSVDVDRLVGDGSNSQDSLDQSFDSEGSSSQHRCSTPGEPLVREEDTGIIVSGTLEELIHELVPRAHASPSDSFQFSFLLSSRLWLTPSQLLAEVCRRSEQLALMMTSASHPAFVANLVRLLSNWCTWFPYDFQEEATMARMRKLSNLCVLRDPSVQGRMTQLLASLVKHLTAVEKHRSYLTKTSKLQIEMEDKKPPVDLSTVPGSSPLLVAQQLTHLELQFLSFIGPDEFVNAFARDSCSKRAINSVEEEGEARLRAGKKTCNLESYIAWFNRLSFLIASSVCAHKKKKHRARTIEFWIEVARECVNIGNFNSMMGIISGLNMSPVSRLRRTWTKIHSGKFAVLGHQIDPTSNFVSYRTTLQAAVTRSENATDKKQRVVIPFFSLLIKDLYFVNEGCASRLPNGHINMEKARTLAEHISQFMKWKDMECPYEKNVKILDYFERSPTFSPKALDFESYELEPPDNGQEKEQYKELKATFKKP